MSAKEPLGEATLIVNREFSRGSGRLRKFAPDCSQLGQGSLAARDFADNAAEPSQGRKDLKTRIFNVCRIQGRTRSGQDEAFGVFHSEADEQITIKGRGKLLVGRNARSFLKPAF